MMSRQCEIFDSYCLANLYIYIAIYPYIAHITSVIVTIGDGAVVSSGFPTHICYKPHTAAIKA